MINSPEIINLIETHHLLVTVVICTLFAVGASLFNKVIRYKLEHTQSMIDAQQRRDRYKQMMIKIVPITLVLYLFLSTFGLKVRQSEQEIDRMSFSRHDYKISVVETASHSHMSVKMTPEFEGKTYHFENVFFDDDELKEYKDIDTLELERFAPEIQSKLEDLFNQYVYVEEIEIVTTEYKKSILFGLITSKTQSYKSQNFDMSFDYDKLKDQALNVLDDTTDKASQLIDDLIKLL